MATLIVLLSCPALHAQNYLNVTVGYGVNFPTGSFKDYVTIRRIRDLMQVWPIP